MASNMMKRVAFAAVAIPAVLAVAWLGRWPFAALLAVAGALGARELYAFARAQGIAPLERLGLLGAAAAPLLVAWPLLAPGPAAMAAPGLALTLWLLVLLGAAVVRRGPDAKPLTAVAVTLLGVLYPAWLLAFALPLRHPLPMRIGSDATVGLALLFLPLVVTWAGDTAAMFGGKAFGGPKMAPVVSPNKTWSGGVSGLLASVAVAVIYAATVLPRAGLAMTLVEALVCGAAISLAGQLGDVAESLFKREVGMKDSSAIIPGHGGVLDRLDSLYFALPVTVVLYGLLGVV